MKKSIVYTSLLVTTILFAQNGRIIKHDREMGLIYYADGSVYSSDESSIDIQNTYTDNTQQTIIREVENGEEVEYIVQDDLDTKEIAPQTQYLPITQPRWQPQPNNIQLQHPKIHKEEYIVENHIQTKNNPIIVQTNKLNNNKKLNIGKIHGHVEFQHSETEIGDQELTQSIYYLETGYQTPEIGGVSAKVSGYVMGDTGFSDLQKKEVMSETGLSEAYVQYKGKNLKAKAGQFRLNTPLTQDRSHEMPNTYQGAIVTSSKVMKDSIIVGSYITDIEKGGIKTEKIASASASYTDNEISVLNIEDVDTNAQLGAKLGTKALDSRYQNNSKVAIAGIINKSLKNTTIQAWEYYAFDVANVTYIDGMMKFKMANGIKTMVGAQIIHQSNKNDDGSISIIGIKGALKYKRGQIIVAINKSTGDVGLHSMGGDPAYTSSKKSKNAYTPDVTATRFIGKYNIPAFKNLIPKNLTLVVSHAAYSQSSNEKSVRDGRETDIVLKYKPKKNLLVVAAYMDKVSDQGDATNKKISYVAVKYKF